MKLKYMTVDGLNICYGEKGHRNKRQPTMILIHGFTACKFMWAPFVKNLPKDYHVIALDMPGHGDSDMPAFEEDISHKATVQKMNKIVKKMGFNTEPFHLVGMSLGGALAGLYAAEFPEHVHSLTLMCPAMKTPIQSPFWDQIHAALDKGVEDLHTSCDLLFPKTPSQVKCMLDFVQYHKSWVPSQILKGVAEYRKSYYPFHAKLFNMITHPDNHDLLQDCAARIQAPTQIIWGEDDKVIDASGVDLLKHLIPNCIQVDLISRCGHSMTTDRPGAMTKAVLKFRQKLQNNKMND